MQEVIFGESGIGFDNAAVLPAAKAACAVPAGRGRSGLLALLVVHYGGSLVGISPVLNPLHLVQSAVLGVPGVILMVVLHFTL
ncbi:MAG: pro-sigmaK processing inhibitor BofA family protein [Ruminococcus callidus]